jgi:hypothetical protein
VVPALGVRRLFPSSSLGRCTGLGTLIRKPKLSRRGRTALHPPSGVIARLVVEIPTKSAPEVWVLEPKMLSSHIEREPVVVKTEEVALVAARIVKDTQKLYRV